MLEFLMMRGEVAIAGRHGKQRIWDLAERVYPSDVSTVPMEEARRLRNERRLRSLGTARAKTIAVEMYKPAAKRRWGYFALPVLSGDRLVGKLDAKADRKAGIFHVNAIHEDVPFDRAIRTGVHAEVEALADWLGLRLVSL